MRRREMIIVMLLVISLVTVSLYQTYATDVIMDAQTPTDTDLAYTVDITDQTGRQITVNAGTTKIVDIFLTNKNNGTIRYGVGYTNDESITSNVKIKESLYSKDTVSDVIGKNETKQITIEIQNNSSNQIVVTLVPISGYVNGGDLIVSDNITIIMQNRAANVPEIMDGMVPVEYLTTSEGVEEDGWYVADETTDWYNYSEQRWANAVLVTEESGLRTASAGTPVSDEPDNTDVLAWYVWIPRYKYMLFNAKKEIGYDDYDAQNTGIDVVFESGTDTTGTVSCTISSIGEETCEKADNGNYYTHPAFEWYDENDQKIQLTGIWVGKFEISSETPDAEYGGGRATTLSVRVKPNLSSWRDNNVSSFSTVIQNMMNEGNIYGINTEETDSHMLKNIEWGAVAYLTHSKYGRCSTGRCTEVEVNSNSSYLTGAGDYETNVGQSTTGNVTGIYDMSGGADEYVMGNMIYLDGQTMLSDSSGFGTNYPAKKYYDVYSYSTDQTAYSRGHLGDATGEIIRQTYYAWNSNNAYFVNLDDPWFMRGGCYDCVTPGVFYFVGGNAFAYDHFSARSALVSAS